MNLLLDTHAFLWFCQDDPALSAAAKALIEDPANRKLISVASCWEIAIKAGLGKLKLGEPSGTYIPTPLIAGDQALAIAQADALKAYGDLGGYRIQIVLEADGWHVDYDLKNSKLKGGGPHHVIDERTGAITSKRYEQ